MSYSVHFSMRNAKYFLGTWVIVPLLTPLFALDVYVHPNGNDQAAGTQGQPVQSLTEARDRLRAASDQADINTVWLGDGRYRMQLTLAQSLVCRSRGNTDPERLDRRRQLAVARRGKQHLESPGAGRPGYT